MKHYKKDTIKKYTKRIVKEAMCQSYNYKTTYKDIKKYFNIFNRTLFKGKLNPMNEVKIRKLKGTWGQVVKEWNTMKGTEKYILELLPLYPTKKEFLNTLIHETVHLADFTINHGTGNHNKYFFSFKNKIKKLKLDLH